MALEPLQEIQQTNKHYALFEDSDSQYIESALRSGGEIQQTNKQVLLAQATQT